jgi:hypothetical protein
VSSGLYFMPMRCLFCFLSLIGLWACERRPAEQAKQPAPVHLRAGQSLPLRFTDSLCIPLGPENTYNLSDVSLLGDSLLYYVSQEARYVVQRANLRAGRMEAPLKLDPNFLPKPSAIYAHSPDSLFLTRDYPPTLFLVDGAGQLRQKWDLGKAPVAWDAPQAKGETQYQFTLGHRVLKKYEPASGRLYLQLSQSYFWYYPDRAKHQDQAVYNLRTNQWELLYGHTPAFYLQEGDWELPDFLTLPDALEKGDTSLLAHPMIHEVTLLNNRTGKLLGQMAMASPAMDKPASLHTKAEREQQGVELDISLLRYARYGFLLHVPQAGLYVREVRLAQPNPNGGESSRKLEHLSTYAIFDAQFKPVGEVFTSKSNPYLLLPLARKDFALGTRKSKFQSNEDTLYLYRYHLAPPAAPGQGTANQQP